MQGPHSQCGADLWHVLAARGRADAADGSPLSATGSPKTAKPPNGLFAIEAWMVSVIRGDLRPEAFGVVTTLNIVPRANRFDHSVFVAGRSNEVLGA